MTPKLAWSGETRKLRHRRRCHRELVFMRTPDLPRQPRRQQRARKCGRQAHHGAHLFAADDLQHLFRVCVTAERHGVVEARQRRQLQVFSHC